MHTERTTSRPLFSLQEELFMFTFFVIEVNLFFLRLSFQFKIKLTNLEP